MHPLRVLLPERVYMCLRASCKIRSPRKQCFAQLPNISSHHRSSRHIKSHIARSFPTCVHVPKPHHGQANPLHVMGQVWALFYMDLSWIGDFQNFRNQIATTNESKGQWGVCELGIWFWNNLGSNDLSGHVRSPWISWIHMIIVTKSNNA